MTFGLKIKMVDHSMNPEFGGAFYEFCYILINDYFFIALENDLFKKPLEINRKLLFNLTTSSLYHSLMLFIKEHDNIIISLFEDFSCISLM